jgi:ABC-type Mn2+/Zn2+ transport system ATPase subunit
MHDLRDLMIDLTTQTDGATSSTELLAQCRDISADYGGPPALEGVDFAVHAGQRIGVLGPNGGGKSTLFRVLTQELRPSAGTLAVGSRCAVLPQTERSRLDYPVSALDVVLMGAITRLPWWRRAGRAERRAALDKLTMVGLRDVAGRTFGDLSGGQRQRVLIARALMQEARLILLDEPFASLDAPSAQRLLELLDALAASGRGILISTHDVEQVRAWDLVLCLNRRQIAFGPPASVLSGPVLEATYGNAIVTLPGEGLEPRRGVLPAVHCHDHEH